MSRVSVRVVLAAVATAAVSLTCTESTGPDPNAVAVVVITPETGSLDTGDSLQLTAVARSADGAELSGKTFVWTTLDPTLVTVSGGMVRGRWPGSARVAATSEGRADTARVTVTPKIDSIALTPALDTLRSIGEQRTLSVAAYIGSQVYDGGEYTWERSDTAFLYLLPGAPTSRTRTVSARNNGRTFVRVREADGAVDSAQIVVRQQVVRLFAFGGAPASRAYRACPLHAGVFPLDARGNVVADAALPWRSSDTTLARVDSTGVITPLALGTVTISVTADTASFSFAISIEAAPVMPLYLSAVGSAPATTVGIAQYVIGEGKVGGGAEAIAPARFRISSSDANVAVVTPADTTVRLFYPFFSEPLRVVGRSVGEVTLTPYLCDVPGPPVALRVTRPHLALMHELPANARTDGDPTSVAVYTQDSAGVTHWPAESLTVRVRTTDPSVMRADSSARHLGVGSQGFVVTVSYVEPGSARLVVEDSAGVYVPDSSEVVQVAYPPLALYRLGDTLRLGMRQHPYVPWDPAYVGVDRIVTGAPLHISLSSSDAAVARTTPESVDIPVGNTADTVDVTSGDTRGTATITARADRHTDARTVVVVGRPAIEWSQIGGLLYPGDAGSLGVIATDSATRIPRGAAEALTVAVSSSDTAIIAFDSPTLSIAAGHATSTTTGVRFKAPGTAILSATDPRAVPYSYAGASLSLTVTALFLEAQSELSLGVDQQWGFGVVINGPLRTGEAVRVAQRNPAVAALADTIAALITPSYAAVLATGTAGGVDSVIASTPGFLPDTGVIVVGTGTSEVVTWPPFGLTVGESWPLYLHVLGPSGDQRMSAVTKTFTLTANDNIEFIQDGVPITTITVAAGYGASSQFYVRGKAAGTGTVTISAPNYSSVTKSVPVTP